MLGAIIGDIVGSRFKFNNHKSKDFELFTDDCYVTDAGIMTIAVAKATMEAIKIIKIRKSSVCDYDFDFYGTYHFMTMKYMQEIGRKYPNCGFSDKFYSWVFSDNPEPDNSFSNEAAAWISPVGFVAQDGWEAKQLAETVTEIINNHEESIKSAETVAAAINMAFRGELKIEIQETYSSDETCREIVPQAIECFLESVSFEDAIRTAISLGGNSSAIGAITGAIAEAYYGVPENLKENALAYLDEDLLEIYDEWAAFTLIKDERFKMMTKYIGKIEAVESLRHREIYHKDGDIQKRFIGHSKLVRMFEKEFCLFAESHPEYELIHYKKILEKNGIKYTPAEIRSVNVQNFDEQCVLALIMSAIRSVHLYGGSLASFFKDGSIPKWLKHLKDIDWKQNPRCFSEITFEIGGIFCGHTIYHFIFEKDQAMFEQINRRNYDKPLNIQHFS